MNENRILRKISIATIITSLAACGIVPAVYKARHYFAIGGEWLLLTTIFVLVLIFADV